MHILLNGMRGLFSRAIFSSPQILAITYGARKGIVTLILDMKRLQVSGSFNVRLQVPLA